MVKQRGKDVGSRAEERAELCRRNFAPVCDFVERALFADKVSEARRIAAGDGAAIVAIADEPVIGHIQRVSRPRFLIRCSSFMGWRGYASSDVRMVHRSSARLGSAR